MGPSSFTQASDPPSPAKAVHTQHGLLKTELGVQETHVRFQDTLLQRSWVLQGPQGTKKQKKKKEKKLNYIQIICHVREEEITGKQSAKLLSKGHIFLIQRSDIALWFYKAFLHKIRFQLEKLKKGM